MFLFVLLLLILFRCMRSREGTRQLTAKTRTTPFALACQPTCPVTSSQMLNHLATGSWNVNCCSRKLGNLPYQVPIPTQSICSRSTMYHALEVGGYEMIYICKCCCEIYSGDFVGEKKHQILGARPPDRINNGRISINSSYHWLLYIIIL